MFAVSLQTTFHRILYPYKAPHLFCILILYKLVNPNDQHYLGIRVPKIKLRRMNDAPSHHITTCPGTLGMYEATLRTLTRAKLQKLAKVCIKFSLKCYRK